MAKKRNSGFFKQEAVIGKTLSDARKPASTTDATSQAKAAGKKYLKPKQEEKVRFSPRFLHTGK